jgi:large subunit ribosomal protein L35
VETIMPKLKTHKGVKKRFRVTKNGRLKHKRAGSGHLLSGKSGKRLRKLRQVIVLAKADTKRLLRLLKLR